MHQADDVHERGALMVARAVAKSPYQQMLDMPADQVARCRRSIMDALTQPTTAFDELMAVRTLSASDAALARAIDAVPGRG